MIDLVGKRFWYFVFSLAVIIPGVISLLIPPALKAGIEFSSGTTMTIQFERQVGEQELLAELSALGHPEAVPQRQTPVSEVAILVDSETFNYEPDKVKQRLSRQFGRLSEFTPAALLQVQFGKPVSEAELQAELGRLGHPEAILERRPGDGGDLWRIAPRSLVAPVTKQELKEREPGEEAKLREALAQRFGALREFVARDIMSVGFEGAVTADQLQDELAAQGHPEATVATQEPPADAPAGTGLTYTIELARLGPPQPAYGDRLAEPNEGDRLLHSLAQRFGPITKGEVRSKLVAQFSVPVTTEDLQAEIKSQGQNSAQVAAETLPDGQRYTIATPYLRPASLAPETIIVTPGEEARLKVALEERFGTTARYVGGTSYRLKFGRGVSDEELAQELKGLGFNSVALRRQPLALGDAYFLRMRPVAAPDRDRIEATLRSQLGGLTIVESATVDPVVAAETARNAFLAVVVAAVFILLYIWWAFRRLRHSFRYSVAAIVALIHDVLVVLGIFSILGKVVNMEVNAMFITGVLTVVGFSVHDTIVVFDRIRENLGRADAPPFEVAVNNSLLETVGRSLNTSITLLLMLLALLLFGGATLRDFVLVIFIGVVTGTYSSIAIAAQLVVSWERGDFGRLGRLLRRLPLVPGAARSRG